MDHEKLQLAQDDENGDRDGWALIQLRSKWQCENENFLKENSISKLCHSRGVTILFMGCNRIVECLDPAAGVPCYKDGASMESTTGIIRQIEAMKAMIYTEDPKDPSITIGNCLFLTLIHLYAGGLISKRMLLFAKLSHKRKLFIVTIITVFAPRLLHTMADATSNNASLFVVKRCMS